MLSIHHKPLIVLHEKALPYESRYVDVLFFAQHQPGFLQASRETTLNPEVRRRLAPPGRSTRAGAEPAPVL